MFRPRQRRSGGNLGLLLLGYQIMNVGLEHIPPVTLATIAGQVAVYLRLLDMYFPSVYDVCISTRTVWYQQDWKRLILGTLYHADDWHLYFNMVSFLWKGRSLERRLGSSYFAYLLVVFTALQSMVLVGLNLLAEQTTGDHSYIQQCAVGFSGVVFALKVVTTHMLPPGVEYVMNLIPVPTRIVCWVELVLIQILVPNASFLGHLAGILVGLAYVKGPLKSMMAPVAGLLNIGPSGMQSFQGAGRSGYRQRGQRSQPTYQNTRYDDHRAPNRYPGSHGNTYSNHAGYHDNDEQLQEAIRRSMADTAAPPSDQDPNMQEAIRRSMQQNYRQTDPSAPPVEGDGNPYPSSSPPPYPTHSPPYPTHNPPYPPGEPAGAYGSSTSHTDPSAPGSPLYPDLDSRSAEDQYQAQNDLNEMRRRRLQRLTKR